MMLLELELIVLFVCSGLFGWWNGWHQQGITAGSRSQASVGCGPLKCWMWPTEVLDVAHWSVGCGPLKCWMWPTEVLDVAHWSVGCGPLKCWMWPTEVLDVAHWSVGCGPLKCWMWPTEVLDVACSKCWIWPKAGARFGLQQLPAVAWRTYWLVSQHGVGCYLSQSKYWLCLWPRYNDTIRHATGK